VRAKAWLLSQGFTFIQQNFRHPKAQIDLLMRQSRVLYVVEVKSGQVDEPGILVKSLGFRQRQRLERAGRVLWSERHLYGCDSVRGILVLVGSSTIQKIHFPLVRDHS